MRKALLPRKGGSRLSAKAHMVAHFLNQTQGEPEQKPVLQLMRMCENLQSLLPKIAARKWTVQGSDELLYDLAADRSARRLLRNINQNLERWKYRKSVNRYMLLAPGEPRSLSVSTDCINPGRFFPKRHGKQMLEGDICEKVIELLEANFLRVRKCRGHSAQPWFVAQRSDQNYCSHKCGQSHYRKNHRTQWALYMRRYRSESL